MLYITGLSCCSTSTGNMIEWCLLMSTLVLNKHRCHVCLVLVFPSRGGEGLYGFLQTRKPMALCPMCRVLWLWLPPPAPLLWTKLWTPMRGGLGSASKRVCRCALTLNGRKSSGETLGRAVGVGWVSVGFCPCLRASRMSRACWRWPRACQI